MTTLRTLKKKSKQAREILIAHYGFGHSHFFLAERVDNYHGFRVRCDHRAKPGRRMMLDGILRCDCQSHPLRGTPMTGEVSGYYEPEWDERTALEELQRLVEWGDRPGSMSEREWRRTLAVSGVTPITDADVQAMLRDDEADDEAGEFIGEDVGND